MASPSLEVAVSTMEETDPEALVARLGLQGQAFSVLIINQVAGAAPAPFQQGSVRMHSFSERGLSRSRNRALALAQGDLLLLADDDIRYLPGFADRVQAAFVQHPRAALLTFQFLDHARGQLAKRYRTRGHRHTPRSIAGLSSIEIGLRRASLPAVTFDERFGLGAEYGSGEEAIFVSDVVRGGGLARYVPEAICSHGGPSSGHLTWDAHTAHEKGAVMRRLFPRTWPLWTPALALVKQPLRAPSLDRWAFTRAMIKGALSLPSSPAPPGRP